MNILSKIKFFLFLLILESITLTLEWLGHGSLALPDWSITAWSLWINSSGLDTVTFTLMREVALVVSIYLTASVILLGLANASRNRPLMNVASFLSTPLVRRIAQRTIGFSLASTLAMPAMANATPAWPESNLPTMRHLTATESLPRFDSTTTTSTVRLELPAMSASPDSQPTAPDQDSVETQSPSTVNLDSPRPQVKASHTHVVAAGENLWDIAEEELHESLNRVPTSDEVRSYWLKIIEVNRPRLPNPNHPDLIYPGQVIQLP